MSHPIFLFLLLFCLLLLAYLFFRGRGKPKTTGEAAARTVQVQNARLLPVIRQMIAEGHTATFRVRGFSMRLFLEDQRDKVLLGPCTTVNKGDVILAEIYPDTYVLHRVIRIDGDRLTLQGDGNIKGTEQCRRKNIVGIALGFYRKDRTQPDMVTGWKWRTYSKVWLALSPFRRIILGIYRRQPFRI